jgi:hypothetical protein
MISMLWVTLRVALYCSSAQRFDSAVRQSIAKIKKLEDQYSRYLVDSLLSEFN